MQEKYKEIFRLLTYCKQNDRECKNQNHLTHNKLWFVTEVLLAPLPKGLKNTPRYLSSRAHPFHVDDSTLELSPTMVPFDKQPFPSNFNTEPAGSVTVAPSKSNCLFMIYVAFFFEKHF